jgi:hypothetical protein
MVRSNPLKRVTTNLISTSREYMIVSRILPLSFLQRLDFPIAVLRIEARDLLLDRVSVPQPELSERFVLIPPLCHEMAWGVQKQLEQGANADIDYKFQVKFVATQSNNSQPDEDFDLPPSAGNTECLSVQDLDLDTLDVQSEIGLVCLLYCRSAK